MIIFLFAIQNISEVDEEHLSKAKWCNQLMKHRLQPATKRETLKIAQLTDRHQTTGEIRLLECRDRRGGK